MCQEEPHDVTIEAPKETSLVDSTDASFLENPQANMVTWIASLLVTAAGAMEVQEVQVEVSASDHEYLATVRTVRNTNLDFRALVRIGVVLTTRTGLIVTRSRLHVHADNHRTLYWWLRPDDSRETLLTRHPQSSRGVNSE